MHINVVAVSWLVVGSVLAIPSHGLLARPSAVIGHPTSAFGHCPSTSPTITPTKQSEWSGWGGNIYNNRWASLNTQVSSSSIDTLTITCQLGYLSGVSATPTVHGDIVYYPTWGGLLVALNYKTCQVHWETNLTNILADFAVSSAVTDFNLPVSRSSPQIEGDTIYFGTLRQALLIALDLDTGSLLDSIAINTHPLAIVTMSPTFYKGQIFVGAASNEEAAADEVPGYVCCSFVANMVALTFSRTAGFAVSWNISMLPNPPSGWSGAALWGSQPSIDISRSQVFIATGNVYTVPYEYQLCQNETSNITVIKDGQTADPCLPIDVYQESVLALDLETGVINWVNQLSPIDSWTLACGASAYGIPHNNILCPHTPGPVADFGIAPTFIPGSKSTPYGKDVVVVGQKNGILWALSAQAGRVLWSALTNPDGVEGGLIWASAADVSQAYVTAINSNLDSWQLQPSNVTISNSAFGSVSLLDGTIVWETAAPFDAQSYVLPSVVNDIVITGFTQKNINTNATNEGGLIIIDKTTGTVVKDIALDTVFREVSRFKMNISCSEPGIPPRRIRVTDHFML